MASAAIVTMFAGVVLLPNIPFGRLAIALRTVAMLIVFGRVISDKN